MADDTSPFTIEECECGRSYWRIYKERQPECMCSYCRGKYLMDVIYFPKEELAENGLNKDESYFIPAEEEEQFYPWLADEGYIVAEGSDAAWLYPPYRTPHYVIHRLHCLHTEYEYMQNRYKEANLEWTLTMRDAMADAISKNAPSAFFGKYAAAVIDLIMYFNIDELKEVLDGLNKENGYTGVENIELTEGVVQCVSHPNYTNDELDASVSNVKRCLEHAIQHYHEYQEIIVNCNVIYDRDIRPLEEKAEELWPQEADLMLEDEANKHRQFALYYDHLFHEIWSAYNQFKNNMLNDVSDSIDNNDEYELYVEE